MEKSKEGPPREKKPIDWGAVTLIAMIPIAFVGLVLAGIWAIPPPPSAKSSAAPPVTAAAPVVPAAIPAEAGDASRAARDAWPESADD